jgi:hypothetical protein
MAHYAFLDENNIVTEVIAGVDETELIEGLDTETWYGNFRGQVCKRTSYNARGEEGDFRGRYAGIGFTYDADADVFISPQPFPSWSLDSSYTWQPPVPYPSSGSYRWDEEDQEWKELPSN